jgi:hypothetical protein
MMAQSLDALQTALRQAQVSTAQAMQAADAAATKNASARQVAGHLGQMQSAASESYVVWGAAASSQAKAHASALREAEAEAIAKNAQQKRSLQAGITDLLGSDDRSILGSARQTTGAGMAAQPIPRLRH